MTRRLAHIRTLGQGPPGWGQTQRWHMAGADPSVSVYDRPSAVEAAGLGRQMRSGIFTERELVGPNEGTLTRRARVSALHSTLPAAAFFRGYASSGTGRSWSGGAVALVGHTPLHQNWNANMQGANELHPATTYDPYPSPSALYPKAV